MADVTDKDREAGYALEARIASLSNAPFNRHVEELCEQAIAQARAEEREACAKVCDERANACRKTIHSTISAVCYDAAAEAIRARGEKGKD